MTTVPARRQPAPASLRLSEAEVQAMISAAAEAGAKKALADIGLDDKGAGRDVAELRDTLRAWRDIKAEASRTAVRVFVTAVLGVIAAATWLYVKTHRGQ